MARARATRAPLERFESKFVPEPNSGCWLWLAANLKDRYGRDSYGVFGWQGHSTILAHRAAWHLYKGEIPAGLDVRHRCDNRLCVNPDHLVIGTRADNMRDAVDRDRLCRGSERGAITKSLWQSKHDSWLAARPRGGSHVLAKLSEEQARAIKSSRELSSVLAKKFGVCTATIRSIRSGRSWSHLEVPHA